MEQQLPIETRALQIAVDSKNPVLLDCLLKRHLEDIYNYGMFNHIVIPLIESGCREMIDVLNKYIGIDNMFDMECAILENSDIEKLRTMPIEWTQEHFYYMLRSIDDVEKFILLKERGVILDTFYSAGVVLSKYEEIDPKMRDLWEDFPIFSLVKSILGDLKVTEKNHDCYYNAVLPEAILSNDIGKMEFCYSLCKYKKDIFPIVLKTKCFKTIRWSLSKYEVMKSYDENLLKDTTDEIRTFIEKYTH